MIEWNVTLELDDRRGEHGRQLHTYKTKEVGDDKHVLTFGRSKLADVALPRSNVSRVHCWMIVNDVGYTWIRDTGSSNGTWVNGSKICDTARFGLADRLYLGDFVIRLVEAPRTDHMVWRLVLQVGYRRGPMGDERVIHRNEVVVGSAKDADLQLPPGNSSRKHCKLRVDDHGVVWMTDLGSTNGTYINGHLAHNEPLRVGDRLHVGTYVITLVEPPKRVPA